MTNRSRGRFEAYRQTRRERQGRAADGGAGPRSGRPAVRPVRRLLGEFFRLLGSHWTSLSLALGTLTVATLLRLAPPAATKLVIDYVLTGRPLPQSLADRFPALTHREQLLAVLCIAVVVIELVATAIHLWGRWHATRISNRLQVAVRRSVFAHAVRLPLHRVYELKSGGAASLLRDDAGGVGELIFSLVYNPWRAIIQLIGSLVVLVWVDWRLMLGGALLVPAVYLSHRTWINRIRPLYRDLRARRQEIDGQTTEVFGGMRVVRTFARERSEAARFVTANDLMIRQSLFVWWWTRFIEIVWEILIPLASVALLWYGGRRVLAGQLTLGDLTMFLVYLTMLLGPLATLVASATALQNNLAGLDRILDLLDEPQELADNRPRRRVVASAVRGRVTLVNVSFRYPNADAWVLREIELDVAAGETVALVGRSGAGKTTLCNLVARFYAPTEGRIELDGTDVDQLDPGSYRRLLGIVEQDVFLFDGTIAENIGYAVPRAEHQAVIAAARAAHADEFITELPHGYETVIGERGVRLSGGQRQRLAIARALLADPRILILDEATSNLDSESEQLIQQSLLMLLAERTCFIIAHRLSTIAHADRIVVLDRGRIVEMGSHAELLSRSGEYRRMVEIQVGAHFVPLLDGGSS